MHLLELIDPLTGCVPCGGDAVIEGIAYDSRAVRPGYLFVAWKGGTFDGHNFIENAVAAGASAVLCEKPMTLDVPVVVVPDAHLALPVIAQKFYSYPSRKLSLVGITGTNGKTTTTYLMQSIFAEAGLKAGLIGTLGTKIGDVSVESEHTTPESSDLQKILSDMCHAGCGAVAMEVSSHGIAMGRTEGCEFDCGVFTNLTQDHLDFHGNLENYLATKLRMFSDYPLKSSKKFTAAVNLDDPSGEAVVKATRGTVITYGIKSDADVKGSEVSVSESAVSFVITYGGKSILATVPIGGYFNAYNGLAAASAALAVGIDLPTIVAGLAKSKQVDGRFESVEAGQDFAVIVDYAHTPDGLENVLKTAKGLTNGRLIAVFGCGGNRDKGKRPIMGRIGAELADVVVVTSDNPRKEDPDAIIGDILAGISPDKHVQVVVDRREAIEWAVANAEKGDLVVIAGKGHEDYQIFADRTIHFDDREVAREAIEKRIEQSDN